MSVVAALVSVEEYLHSSYRPDCDYVDGVLQERHGGEKDHARLQALLIAAFFMQEASWGIHVYPELRCQISPAHFRVPDIVVLHEDAPDEQIITHAPLLLIEILSPGDTFYSTSEKIEDYLSFGVPNIWVIDSKLRRGYVCESPNFTEWRKEPVLRGKGTEIAIDVQELFRGLKRP